MLVSQNIPTILWIDILIQTFNRIRRNSINGLPEDNGTSSVLAVLVEPPLICS